MTPLENVLTTAHNWQRIFATESLPVSFTIKYNKTADTSYIKMELFHLDRYYTLIYYGNSPIEKAYEYFNKLKNIHQELKQ